MVVKPYVHRTALTSSETLSRMIGGSIWIKPENLQKTGAFKARGAINALSKLSGEERGRGVITVSAGNHGIALSYAGRAFDTSVTVVMPETAVRSKIAAIEGYGGTAALVDGKRLMESMETIRAEHGQTFIHPFDHPPVTAGQGTAGLEIIEDLPDADVVVVPVGGGGLISGIATAVKGRSPGTRVVGVEPEGSTAVLQSLKAGKPLALESFSTVADGLNAPWAGANTLAIIQRHVDEVVTVTDDQILEALVLIAERCKLLVEPAGAAAVAGLLSGKVPNIEGKQIVVVLSGGNIDRAALATYLERFPTS